MNKEEYDKLKLKDIKDLTDDEVELIKKYEDDNNNTDNNIGNSTNNTDDNIINDTVSSEQLRKELEKREKGTEYQEAQAKKRADDKKD